MTAYRGLLWEVFTPPQLLLCTLVSGKPAILTICILPVAVTLGYKRFVCVFTVVTAWIITDPDSLILSRQINYNMADNQVQRMHTFTL